MPEKIDELFIEVRNNFDETANKLDRLLGEFSKFGKQANQSSERAAKGIDKLNKSLGTAGRFLAGGALANVGAKITGVLGNAVAASNRLEQSFISLEAAVKRLDSGASLEKVKKQVVDLAKDGFLSVQQASEAFRTSLETTQSAEKSFKLVNAVKQIAALENTTGDGAESTREFFKAILTGSTEVIDNASPRFKAIAKDLGGFAKVSNDAAVRQEFFNRIIQESAQVQEGYNKFLESGAGAQQRFANQVELLNASIGDALKPLLVELFQILQPIIEGLTDFIKGLNGTQKAVLAISAVLVAAIPVVAAFVVALGPIGLIAIGITAALGGTAFALAGLTSESDKAVKAAQKAEVGYRAEKKALEDLASQQKLSADQERELGNIKKDLEKRAKAVGLSYDIQAKSAKDLLAVQKEIIQAERQLAAANIAKVNADLVGQRRSLDARISRAQERVEGSTGGRRARAQRTLNNLRGQRRELDQDVEKLRTQIALLDKDFEETAETTKGLGKATKDASAQVKESFERINVPAEGIIEELLAIEMSAKKARKDLDDALRKELITRKEYNEDLEKINKIEERQRTQAIAGATSSAFGGASQLVTSENASGQLGGLSTIAGAFSPTGGAVIGAAGAAAGFVESIFGNREKERAEELARIEQERILLLQKQRELIEQQVRSTEILNNLERERNQNINKAAELQIRVNNLTIDDEAERLEANKEVLEGLAGSLRDQAGLSGGAGAEEAAGKARRLNQKKVDSAALSAALDLAVGAFDGLGNLGLQQGVEVLTAARANLLSAVNASPNADAGITNKANETINIFNRQIESIKKFQKKNKAEIATAGLFGGKFDVDDALKKRDEIDQADIDRLTGGTDDILAGIDDDLGNLDEFISALEDIQSIEEQQADLNADQTGTSLQLQDGRALSFVDVGRGGVQSLGQFVGTAQRITPDQLGLPSGASAVSLAAADVPSFQERQALALEDLVQIQSAALQLLGAIAQNSNTTTGFSSASPLDLVAQGLADLESLAV